MMKADAKARGMTLIEVLVATAIVGLVASIIAGIFSILSGYMGRSDAERNIDSSTSYIYGLLGDRNQCAKALRFNGAVITWANYSNPVTVNQLWTTNPTGTSTKVMDIPFAFSPTLTLTGAIIREPTGTNGEPGPVQTTVTQGPNTYDSVSARLVLTYTGQGNLFGGTSFRPRYIDLTLGLTQTVPHQIKFCYPSSAQEIQSLDCTAANPPCPTQPYNVCSKVFYVAGFDSAGKPICKCQWSCPPAVTVYTVTPPSGSTSSGSPVSGGSSGSPSGSY